MIEIYYETDWSGKWKCYKLNNEVGTIIRDLKEPSLEFNLDRSKIRPKLEFPFEKLKNKLVSKGMLTEEEAGLL